MVETITPVVYGGRGRRWILLLGLHATGATVAAAAFGAVVAGLGAMLHTPWDASAALVAALAAIYLAEVLGARVPVPQLRRQVPNWWRSFFPFGIASFLYGMGLGVGFFTYLTRGTLVVVSAVAFVSGDPLIGALLLAPFGLARGSTAAVAFRSRTPEEGSALVGRLARSASWPGWRVAHGVVLTAVLTTALVAFGERGVSADVGELAAASLAIVFGVAAIAKLARGPAWRRWLASYGLPPRIERPARLGVLAVELGIAGMVVLGYASAAGLAALVALVAFSTAIVAARVRVGPKLGCGCFAGDRIRDYRYLLGRNAVLMAVAAVAWLEGVDAPPSVSFGTPGASDVLPALLVVLGLVLSPLVAIGTLRAIRRSAVR
ncbi:MAG TPA: MauE/DoxX family redox-associated membrane protein [Actinomycetota bacterium]|nr:MauE/DoxX family redox-associated membrane protein [Actinomycetota bacterium]